MSLIIGSGIAAFLIYTAHKWEWHDRETKIILNVFKNINYKIKDQLPRLFKKSDHDNYTDYIFTVPYGLTDKNEIKPTLEKTLGKIVTVKFKRKLFVRVYKEELKTKYDYDWRKTKGWTVPVGYTLDGMIYHDEVEFYIIDLKRLEFSRYRNIKQVKHVARDTKEAKECLKNIVNKMDRDMADFEGKGYNNIISTDIKRRTFIVVDEGGQLDKNLHPHLEKIAQMGGAVGYRLIFATQYSTGDVFPRQVKQNSDAKIAFRLPTETASRVAIDEMGAEQLTCPGRAIYRTAERYLVQVPLVDDNDIERNLRRFEVENHTEDTETGEDTIILG